MSLRPVAEPAPTGMKRVAAFTLATALAWVGHECPGDCPRLSAQLRASVWFLTCAATADDVPRQTRVVVRFDGHAHPGVPRRSMLREVNQCVSRDRIVVREWEPADAPGAGEQHDEADARG